MSDLPNGSVDDEFIARLAAHDDALQAQRPTNLAEETATLPPDLRQKLAKYGAWCEFVRAAWNTTGDAAPREGVRTLADADTLRRFGRFEVRRELGRGAFGVVFLAFDPGLRRQVALKLPRPEVMVTPEIRARFEREARAAAGLDHPNLVPVFEAGVEGSINFITSAYCAGPTLSEWLKARDEPVPPRLAARIVAQLAGAIAHAHARGVLHRDLKPGNVILERLPEGAESLVGDDGMDFTPRVTDFGLARMTATGPEATAATQSGEILGTPSYMSPEQAEGRPGAIGPATDVYGLGAILYALLVGRPPFQSHSPLDTMLLLRTQEPIAPSRLRPRLPRDLETVCLKCLDKRPQHRYGSPAELAKDLDRYLAGKPVVARRVGAAARFALWCRRQPALASTIAAAILLIATVASLGVWRVVRERDRYLAERDRFLDERDHAQSSLVRALTGEAHGLIQTRETAWRFTALEKLREASQLAGPSHDRTEQRELAIQCFGAEVPCFRLEQTWSTASGKVLSTGFSPDGGSVAAGTSEGLIYVWSIGSEQPRVIRTGSDKAVTAVDYHPGGAWLAASSEDGSVRVWKIHAGAVLEPPTSALKDEAPMDSVRFSPKGDWLAAGGEKGTLRMFPFAAQAANPLARAQDQARILTGHAGRVSELAFTQTGKLLASLSYDVRASFATKILFWDVTTGKRIRQLTFPPPATLRGLAFFPNAADERYSSIVWANRESYGLSWTDGLAHRVSSHQFLLPERPNGALVDSKGRLFTALADGSVRLWVHADLGNAVDYKSLAIATGEFGPALALCLNRGEDRVAVGYRDGRVRLWQLTEPPERDLAPAAHNVAFKPNSRRLMHPYGVTDFSHARNAKTGTIRKVAPRALEVLDHGSKVALADDDGNIVLWNIATGRELGSMRHGSPVIALSASPDGKLMASGSVNGTTIVWDCNRETVIQTISPGLGEVGSLAWSPDGGALAIGGELGVTVTKVGQSVVATSKLEATGPAPQVVAWGKESIALSADDGAIAIIDPQTGHRRQLLRGHSAHVVALAYLCDGRRLASIARDETLRVWDTERGTQESVIQDENLGNFFLAIDPRGRYAVTDCSRGTAVCDVGLGALVARLLHRNASGRFTPDGSQVLARAGAGVVRYSVAAIDESCKQVSGKTEANVTVAQPLLAPTASILPSAGGIIYGMAGSPNGRWVATCSADKNIRLWDVRTRKPRPRVISGHSDVVWCAAWGGDSKLLASGSENTRGSEIKIWDVETGRQIHHLEAPDALVMGLTFVPGRPWLASGTLDGKVRLWDYKSGKQLGLLHAFGVQVSDLAARSDGKWLAAASYDGTVALWEPARLGRLPQPPHRSLTGHNAPVHSVAFHPDGRWLVSGSEQGTVFLWDGTTFERIVRLRGGGGQVRCLRFSADRTLLAAAAYQAPTIVWDLVELRRSLRELDLDW